MGGISGGPVLAAESGNYPFRIAFDYAPDLIQQRLDA
ncbi:MAG: hypothetical protein QOJ04_4988, partial [Caballeronia sp.]|nr:hypothetical protein [Caballeronia sp.]